MWFLLVLGCVLPTSRAPDEGVEVDLPYAARVALDGGPVPLRVDGARLLADDGAVLAPALVDAPVAAGGRVCAADDAGGEGSVTCWSRGRDGRPAAVELARGGRPDRLALAPDGATVAWVAAPEGLPAVLVAPADGSSPPRALTNVGLARPAGGPPPGFVAPPLGASLRFDGDVLRWDSPDGPQEVAWR